MSEPEREVESEPRGAKVMDEPRDFPINKKDYRNYYQSERESEREDYRRFGSSEIEQGRARAQGLALMYGFDSSKYRRKDQSESTSGVARTEQIAGDPPDFENNKEAEKAKEIRDEVNKLGLQPASLLGHLMKTNRVLALGEGHSSAEPTEKLLIEQMSNLKDSGATHLAVEISDNYQAALDKYLDTGDSSGLPPYVSVNERYMDTLRAAKNAGLKVVAVDKQNQPEKETPERDPYMAHKIDQILSQSKDSKVIFLVGERHTDDFAGLSADKRQHRALEFLRDKYHDVASLSYVRAGQGPAGEAFPDLKFPTAVALKQATAIANANKSFPDTQDFAILYPGNY